MHFLAFTLTWQHYDTDCVFQTMSRHFQLKPKNRKKEFRGYCWTLKRYPTFKRFVCRSGSDVTSYRLRFLSHLKRSYAIPPLSTKQYRVQEANQGTKSGNSWMHLWILDFLSRCSSFSVQSKVSNMLISWNEWVGLSYISAHRFFHRANVC